MNFIQVMYIYFELTFLRAKVSLFLVFLFHLSRKMISFRPIRYKKNSNCWKIREFGLFNSVKNIQNIHRFKIFLLCQVNHRLKNSWCSRIQKRGPSITSVYQQTTWQLETLCKFLIFNGFVSH